MARAIIRQDGDGGLEVVVPAWDDSVITSVSWRVVAEAFEEAGEDNYDGLSDELTLIITDQLKDPAVALDGKLRAAIYQAVAPGPGFNEPLTFTV